MTAQFFRMISYFVTTTVVLAKVNSAIPGHQFCGIGSKSSASSPPSDYFLFLRHPAFLLPLRVSSAAAIKRARIPVTVKRPTTTSRLPLKIGIRACPNAGQRFWSS